MPGEGTQEHNKRPITQFIWEAVYGDGERSLLEWEVQADGSFVQHFFADIDLPNCTAIILHSLTSPIPDISVKVDPQAGQRPIFFRRYAQTYHFGSGETEHFEPLHVLGWQRTIHGVNVAHYTFVFPDGSILLSDDKNCV